MGAATLEKPKTDTKTDAKIDNKPMRDQLSLIPGGRDPSEAEIKLKAAKKSIDDEHKMGDTIKLEIEAVVTEVAFVDVFDKDGYWDHAERRHVLTVDSITVVED